jgi:hypothetical protein
MSDVIAQDFLFGSAQSCTHGCDLGDDVDTIAIVFDHPRQAADLTLDTVKTLEARTQVNPQHD